GNSSNIVIDHAMFVATPGHRAALLWQQIAGRLSYENAPRCFELSGEKTERTATKTISKGRSCYATGGARDRKASRSGSASGCAAQKLCSTRSKFAGTSNCGGADANALDARKIVAQIAQ